MSELYDVIVVGSGSGGGVVASRLSEDPGVRVLLLEAGPDTGGEVPDEIRYVRGGSGVGSLDWDYSDPSIGVALPRGKVVGGSSAVNSTIALRGQPEDYDIWARKGAQGWSWEDCLPYFRRLETDADFRDRPWHGDGGPIHIQRHLPMNPTEELFVAACQELGHEVVDDQNEPGRIGAGPVPRNIKDWERQSVMVTYLAPARARPNLTIKAPTLVDRILLDGSRASGVRLQSGEEIRARRVVLAAGAYNSPPLLLRSGIGPAADLSELGIDCRVDLGGVGQNLMDHPVTMIAVQMEHPIDPEHVRLGPMVKTRSRPELELDDLKITLFPGQHFNMAGISGLYLEVNVSDTRGSVGLESADPAVNPVIKHRFLSDERDVTRMLAGVRQVADLAGVMDKTTACEVLLPDAETLVDEALLREHVMQFHGTGYHPCGTCRMGRAEDQLAVVDERLRVRGVDNLYVVDASVMPEVPRCNINLPTMMIGERGADFVRDEL